MWAWHLLGAFYLTINLIRSCRIKNDLLLLKDTRTLRIICKSCSLSLPLILYFQHPIQSSMRGTTQCGHLDCQIKVHNTTHLRKWVNANCLESWDGIYIHLDYSGWNHALILLFIKTPYLWPFLKEGKVFKGLCMAEIRMAKRWTDV